MHRIFRRLRAVGLIAVFSLQAISAPLAFAAPIDDIDAPPLDIVQLKVNSDSQFVTIFNPAEDDVDLESYELIYLNADNKPTKTFVFSGVLAPQSYFVLNDGKFNACHLMSLESVSMNFSTTGGSVQLWHYKDDYNKTLDSQVTWAKSKKTDTSASTLVLPSDNSQFLNKSDDDWLVVSPSADDACQLETVKTAEETSVKKISFSLLPGSLPPVRFVSNPSNKKQITNRNPGKMAPVINELLPNPASPQKDSDDEFIELYNPNSTTFDLTDFKLAFGSNDPRKYTFPEGAKLRAGEFKVFTSGDTSISLSNTEAQVWLLDPNGEVVSQSDPYQGAKDGQAWALNNGTWQWTSAPSPNDSNTLTSESSDDKDDDAAKVLGITSSTGGSGTPGATLATTTNGSQLDDATPLHPLVLAGVGLLAVGYALYEYRHDIGNKIYKFRRHLQARRAIR